MKKLIVALSVLALASCGTPKKAPDDKSNGTDGSKQPAVDPNSGAPTDFSSVCLAKTGGRLVNGTNACRYEVARVELEDMPWGNGKPSVPPVTLPVSKITGEMVSLKGFSSLKSGVVRIWNSADSNHPQFAPWDGYKSFAPGDWYITIDSRTIQNLMVILEGCYTAKGFVDCDTLN